MKKNILIVGGSSGVGFELARRYVEEGHRVCVAGWTDPKLPGAQFCRLAITASTDSLSQGVDNVITAFQDVHTLVYAAGFLQRGFIDELTDEALLTMNNVGLVAPMMLAARLKPLAPTPALPGCSMFGDDSPASVAIAYLEANRKSITVHNCRVDDADVSNCSGDGNRSTCIVSHTAPFDRAGPKGSFDIQMVKTKAYEEGEMEFVKSPSGWNAKRYKTVRQEAR